MSATLYHNPRCSKSRRALTLLREHGVEPRIVEYLKHPPSREDLETILLRLGLEPRELMRTKQEEYKEHFLDNPALTRDQLIDAMLEHPILIERPIVLSGKRGGPGPPPAPGGGGP
jgi:arsenate reductase